MTDLALYEACKECIVKSTCTKNIKQETACDLQIRQQLEDYLKYNFIPSITNQKAIETIFKVIQEVNKGNFNYEVEAINGEKIKACDVIEELHLEYFLKGDKK